MVPLFTELLLNWYARNSRKLPWRDQPDPYRVWVSEIMLQQTRVETVIPYFERWMQRFPRLADLANAPQQAVLAAWEGLGYYSRARNLQRAAQVVVSEYHGSLPADARQLQSLPGIGRYTAGAIASIAFGLDEPALDGNIRRVLSRVFNVEEPSGSPLGEHKLWALAEQGLPSGHAAQYNQALMDLGASLCSPRAPDCVNCPLAQVCLAHALGLEDQRPVRKRREAVPQYVVTAAVIWREGLVLIAQRPLEGLLGGLWEFPGGKLDDGEDLASCLQREICEELGVNVAVGGPLGVYRHAYTHFRVVLHAFQCNLLGEGEPRPLQVRDLRWITRSELKDYPMGKIDRRIALKLLEEPFPCSS